LNEACLVARAIEIDTRGALAIGMISNARLLVMPVHTRSTMVGSNTNRPQPGNGRRKQ
jgi:hypothetical protein